MTSVSIRDFQLNPGRYLKKLPFVITKYNKPLVIVSKYKDADPYLKEKDK